MQVWLVRHGPAVDLGEAGTVRDEERMLSGEGRKRTRAAARGFSRFGIEPARLVSSTLKRARETADLFREAMGCPAEVETLDVLRPYDDPEDALAWLEQQAPGGVFMLVGHMPHLGALAGLALNRNGEAHVQFKKCAACCLEFSNSVAPGEGLLVCHLAPRQLRALGG